MSRGYRLRSALHGEAQLGERAGLQVLHEHVGLGHDRLEQAAVLGLGEVGDDGFLAAVEPHEVRALALDEPVVVAREIALGPLQLDHPRPRIGELARGHRRGHGLVERERPRVPASGLGHTAIPMHRASQQSSAPRARLRISAPVPNSQGRASVDSVMRLASSAQLRRGDGRHVALLVREALALGAAVLHGREHGAEVEHGAVGILVMTAQHLLDEVGRIAGDLRPSTSGPRA